MNKENIKIGAGYSLICLIWGSTWLFIRIGLESLTPVFAAGLRFVLASILIYGVMRIRKIRLQTDSLSIKLYLIMGFFSFVIPFGLVYWAEQFINSGMSAVLFGVFPFSVILWSKLAFKNEQVGIYKILGVVLGFIGIVIIFSENLTLSLYKDFWGMSAVVLSAVMQGGIAITIKKYGRHLNSLSMNLVPVAIAGVTMVIAGYFLEDSSKWNFDYKAFSSIAYLAFFGTLMTFTTYYWLLKRINVVILSLGTFIEPILAVFLGWLFYREMLTINDFIGSSLVLIGILFANFRGLINYYGKKERS